MSPPALSPLHLTTPIAMAAHLPLLLLLVFLFSPSSIAAAPKALLAPIAYDPSTSLYALTLGHDKLPLLLDLASSNLWQDCVNPIYTSPSLKPVLCNSAICKAAKVCNSLICGTAGCFTCNEPASPVCFNNSCSTFISNSAISTTTSGLVWTDTISVLSTDGKNPGPLIKVPKFAFVCGDGLLLPSHSVPEGAVGAAGLSRAKLALPTQLAAKLSLKQKFAYCLPSTNNANGVLFFGDSPYVFLPGIDISNNLAYTPLLKDPKEPDSYFIGVNSISVNGVELPINTALLKFKKDGNGATKGGTRLSTTDRYTKLEPSIYTALAREFKKAAKARGIKEVTPIKPFDTCFDASTASSTRVGYNVPEIDFSLQGSGGVVWQFFGANSVVSLDNDKVICLAFQKTGEFEPRSIILGTFQQQNALLQFDLATSRLGILPTLLGLMTTCSNFNFTSSH